MWLVSPRKMCRKHLLGEHVELHMMVGHLKLKRQVSGYVEKNLFEPLSMRDRHDEIVREMNRRGYAHHSALGRPRLSHLPKDQREAKINRAAAEKELMRRCRECRKGQ